MITGLSDEQREILIEALTAFAAKHRRLGQMDAKNAMDRRAAVIALDLISALRCST